MDQPQAFGTFVKRYGKIFRTSSYIQWGESRQSLGAVLMLNPGSAEFGKMNPKMGLRLDQFGAAMGKIHPDQTMDQLIRLVDQFYESRPSGRLQIYNLFNLRGAYAEKAIKDFEELVVHDRITLEEALASIGELQNHPWILIGWGLHRKNKWKFLQKTKDLWLEQIRTAGIPFFGSQNDRGDYYHPAPLLKTERDHLLSELTEQFNTEIKPVIPFETLTRHRYMVLKWNGEGGTAAQYIVKDNLKGTQGLVSVGQKPVWFHLELAGDPAVANWIDDCEKNPDWL